ncbi:unnamed protein product [Fraxinus pennsylvanica]|uniref:F-box domain-containing protein n=1 Tax=Fraxinus pennsylvanica TaxID=56036 RepID=A0AAD1ZGI4_9LAMI|nr:unnamed protein product [Fraxinus pennsylvanica]
MSIESCTDFQELPEGCIANVLSLTSLKDVCRLSLVNSTFRSAAESDAIWERFLPPDYRHIISRSIEGADSILAKFRTKKGLYLYLCHNHILIDGGTKSFSLEKGTGKKCFMLASRDLFIVMGDAPEFCKWISYPNSRFPEVAELLAVRRFEICGKINTGMLSSGTKYAAYIVFTSRSRIEGFKYQISKASIQIGQETKQRIVCIDPDEEQRQRCMTVPCPTFFMHQISHLCSSIDNMPAMPNARYPRLRGDGWLEVQLGEFLVKEKHDRDVKIILKEIKRGIWKSSLIIQGIEIRPRAA